MRLAVAMPTHDMVPAGFMYDLARMMMYTASHMPEGSQLGLTMVTETYIHRARQDLAFALVTQEVDAILWLDTDMRFPQHTLMTLLKHQEAVVGINYITRGVPGHYVAVKKSHTDEDGQRERLSTLEDSTGLEQVDSIGFGAVLTRVNPFTYPSDSQPWFMFSMDEDGSHVGEDVHYCRILKEQGVPIYVDHDLSKECAHIGSFEYRLEHLEAEQAAV